MPRQCPFPVRTSDPRRCYRAGSAPLALSLALAAALFGHASLSEAAPAPASEEVVSKGAVVGWARGRLLVAPRAGLSDKEFEKALKGQNAKSKGRFQRGNAHVIELPPGADELKAMQALKKDKRLKYVELDMALAHDAIVTDPNYIKSWAPPKIQAPIAWDAANGSGVTIAILDSGIDGNHPDMAANLVPGWNFFDNNSNTADVYGHGTKVAGAAGAVANNGTGSAGVAWGARIMPVRIAGTDGLAYFSTIAQGLYWAADNGAKVANVSFSGVSGSATVQAAAEYLRGKGGVVVASAGNTGGLQAYSANDSILVAAATDGNDKRATWSSYGDYVDLAAPGVSIYTTIKGGGYANVSGTSLSSPITAATVALMLSANSKLAPADVEKILKSTAIDLGTTGADPYYGAGRIDSAKAVALARNHVATDTQPPTISIASPTGGKVSGVVPVDVNYSDNVGVTRAELYVNGSKVATDDASPFAFAWDTAAYGDGSYTLVARAYDAAGNVGASPSVSVSIGNDSTAPTISNFNLTAGMTISPTRQTVNVRAADNQSVAKISLVIDGKEVAVAYGSTLKYSWNTRKLATGAHTVTVRMTDNSGNVSSQTVTVYR